jgi:hypothetical protein
VINMGGECLDRIDDRVEASGAQQIVSALARRGLEGRQVNGAPRANVRE